MPDRPEHDPGRQPTLIDPLAAVTERLILPSGAEIAREEPVVVGNRYEIRELLASGGMCDVWRAHDPVLEREVAVKQLLPRWRDEERVRERFAAEALRVAKLSHPAIVGVLDAGEDAAGPFLVMELIDGPSLDQCLAEEGRLPVDQSVDIGKAVARGLAAAHRAGIVHRDVKPGNIMLDRRHGARLTDFGIAKATIDIDLTTTGEIIGTAAYLAPEQAMGLTVDHRSDIYALGCVLFECLTGQRPFGGDTPVQTASARIGAHVRVSDRVRGIPAAIEAVVARAMAPEPADRWPDGDVMATALVAAATHPTAPSVLPGPDEPAPRRPRPATPVDGLPAVPRVPHAATDATGSADDRIWAGPTDVGDRSTPAEEAPTARDVGGQAGPPPDAADDRRPPSGTGPGSARRREARVTMAIALTGIIIAGSLALVVQGGGSVPTAEDGTGATESTGAAGGEVTAVPQLQLASFDPGGGDGENDGDLANLTDGDPATRWTTDGYDSAAFGNLKQGVGVLIDLGSVLTVAEVRLFGMPEGQNLELRVADAAPTQLADTSVVGQASGLGSEEAVQPDEEIATQFLVVWLVADLPPDGGRFRGGFGEIEVLSR